MIWINDLNKRDEWMRCMNKMNGLEEYMRWMNEITNEMNKEMIEWDKWMGIIDEIKK